MVGVAAPESQVGALERRPRGERGVPSVDPSAQLHRSNGTFLSGCNNGQYGSYGKYG